MEEDSILFKYLLDSGFLSLDEKEIETKYTNRLKNQLNHLKQTLSNKQFKAVRHYMSDLTNHIFTIRNKECFKMLYLGIKLGMEVNAFCVK